MWDRLLGRADIVLDALPLRAWPYTREEERPARLEVSWPRAAMAADPRDPAARPGETEASAGAEDATVAIELEAVSGGTVVDLRHEGWPESPDPAAQNAIAGHFAGWLQALAALGLLTETGTDPRASTAALASRSRYFASAEIPASADAVYRALTDPTVLARWSEGALEAGGITDSVESRYLRWRLPAAGEGEARELVIILRPTPRGTHAALAEYGVSGQAASLRGPQMLERLALFLR